MAKPTFTDLWELLNYEFETGKLWWRHRDIKWCVTQHEYRRWNTCWANKEAFTTVHAIDNYKMGAILGKTYKAHHVIWTMCYGYWPEKTIDHIDGDQTNNRLINLRKVTPSESAKNKSIQKSNTSGMQGVSFNVENNKWRVRANAQMKRIHLGYYETFEEAVQVRKQAEIDYGYHPNHGRPGR